jgi:uncharacterized protein (TIRG00374 family)
VTQSSRPSGVARPDGAPTVRGRFRNAGAAPICEHGAAPGCDAGMEAPSRVEPDVPSRGDKRLVIQAILGLAVGLAILGVWLYAIGFQDILSTLRTVAPVPALVAVLAWVTSMVLRSWKWHILLRMLDPVHQIEHAEVSAQEIGFRTSGRVYWVSSFLNVIFPFRVGELARSLLLKQLANLPVSASLPTVLVDRLYSIAAILLGLLFLPLAPFQLQTSAGTRGLWIPSVRWGIGIVAALFLCTLGILYLLRHQKVGMLRLARHMLFMLPEQWVERILGFVGTMIDSMRFVRPDTRRRRVPHRAGATWSALGLLAWSLTVLLADAAKDHFVLRAFGLNVPLTTCFLGVCLTNLAFILPSPPGNIGSNQWYATLVYSSGFGYDASRVAGGALFGHAMTTMVVAIGGALALSGLGINLAESLRISQGSALPGSGLPGGALPDDPLFEPAPKQEPGA